MAQIEQHNDSLSSSGAGFNAWPDLRVTPDLPESSEAAQTSEASPTDVSQTSRPSHQSSAPATQTSAPPAPLNIFANEPPQPIATPKEKHPEMVYSMPAAPQPVKEVKHISNLGTQQLSWVLTFVIFLIVVIAIRFRNNRKFLATAMQDLVDVSMRHKFPTGTVKETSFVLILNLLYAVNMGIIYYHILMHYAPEAAAGQFALYICIGVCLAFCIFMPLIYRLWIYVFAKREIGESWMRGLNASQMILGVTLTIPAFLLFLHSSSIMLILGICAGIYIFVKLLFIIKGLRIFITDFYSFIVFLYYLCALEIVPLVLMYILSKYLCILIQ